MEPNLSTTFSTDDRRQIEQRGMAFDDVCAQLQRFVRPRRYIQLVRPCTLGDGIESLDAPAQSAAIAQHATAEAAGRYTKFVPASGAASRMFRDLLYFHQGPGRGASWDEVTESARSAGEGSNAHGLVRFLESLDQFAFVDDLARVTTQRGLDLPTLRARNDFHPILEALLADDGLAYGETPKGLLPFHRYPQGGRMPFEEHLVEAAGYARDRTGKSRLHFSVSPEHRCRFQARFEAVESAFRDRLATEFAVGYSEQDPASDTLAVDADYRPLRDAQGRLVFRPGGHGALIANLNRLGADLVFIKNIDNVQPDRSKPQMIEWKRVLGGLLVQTQERIFDALRSLDQRNEQDDLGTDLDDQHADKLRAALGAALNGNLRGAGRSRRLWLEQLNRPLRVCGVVPNTGEPGGGPFWVREPDGRVTPQLVEQAQVDPDDAEQQKIFRTSTHFSPVDLVCGLQDYRGQAFDLTRFVDPEAVILTRKSAAGRDLWAQERPGLWNGAMAGWNTIFVDVPLATFTPVKTVLDLLRPEHQP